MITTLDQVSEQRLCWPETKPRAAQRIDGAFKGHEVASVENRIGWEMARWGIRAYIISRNNQRLFAGDPGAALWWTDRQGELRVLACDKYKKLANNLRAIQITLEAMRGLERWGAYTAEQAAEGARLALPAPDSDSVPDWRKLFGHIDGIPNDKQLVLVEHDYRAKSREANGNAERQKILNLAIEAARKELA